jgi:hypothetical protein
MMVPLDTQRPADAPAPHPLSFLRPDWSALNLWNGLIGGSGLGLIILLGLVSGSPAASAIAAGGAVSVAFGAVMSFSRWRGAPLALAGVGMAISAFIGSLAGHSLPVLVAVSGLWAAATALATTLGLGAWWIVLQWSVGLIVAGAYPASLVGALERGALVLAGSVVQTGASLIAWRWRGPGEPIEPPYPLSGVAGQLRAAFAARRHPILFACRAAAAVMVATLAARGLGLANDYWAPLTAVVVLKPRWRETWQRGAQRIVGTCVGAVAATIAAVIIGPEPWLIGACAFGAGAAAIAVQRVSYAVFSAALTAYIVYLLALLHTPAPTVAAHRVIATLIGASLAVAVDGVLSALDPWRSPTRSPSAAASRPTGGPPGDPAAATQGPASGAGGA